MTPIIRSPITLAVLTLLLLTSLSVAPHAAQANGSRPSAHWKGPEPVSFGPRSRAHVLQVPPAAMSRPAVTRSLTVSSDGELTLPRSAFPTYSVLVDSGAMTARDADGSAFATFHAQSYTALGMKGGWIQYYTLRLPDGGLFDAVYLGTYYSSVAAARAAFADIAGSMDASGYALPCSGGDRCDEAPITIDFDDGTYVGLYRVIQRSNAVMEAASVVPALDYDAMQSTVEKTVDGITAGFLALPSTADPTSTAIPPTATPTNTPVPPTATPSPTAVPTQATQATPATPTATPVRHKGKKPPRSKRCKKGYKLIRGKCRKYR